MLLTTGGLRSATRRLCLYEFDGFIRRHSCRQLAKPYRSLVLTISIGVLFVCHEPIFAQASFRMGAKDMAPSSAYAARTQLGMGVSVSTYVPSGWG
ncbi:hypothetical protein GCM10010124_30900 [Pilimelia terevasa]|uniref:Uncharacterized protein n=1 Tax=Pilimelia terevasa TaxID=53372 RepID=A0A8J3FL01_9ACTN|nr:hypothetical protein GCM10010124_30900 [Pilimelia terevasa]